MTGAAAGIAFFAVCEGAVCGRLEAAFFAAGIGAPFFSAAFFGAAFFEAAFFGADFFAVFFTPFAVFWAELPTAFLDDFAFGSFVPFLTVDLPLAIFPAFDIFFFAMRIPRWISMGVDSRTANDRPSERNPDASTPGETRQCAAIMLL